MKKFVMGVAVLAMATSAFAATASAANKAGVDVNYTETEAYVNNTNIPAFMAEDHTVVRTRDLRNIGFNCEWDPYARAVYVSVNNLPGIGTYKYAPTGTDTWVNHSFHQGDLYRESVPSDIKVYMNGTEVVSYNTGAETFVRLTDLVLAGNNIHKFYDPTLNISWINVGDFAMNAADTVTGAKAVPTLTTEEALSYAVAYTDAMFGDSLVVENSDSGWREFYVDTVLPTFPPFNLVDTRTGVIMGTVTVGVDGFNDVAINDTISNGPLAAIYVK